MIERQVKSQKVNMLKSRNYSTKSIGRSLSLILKISVTGSTPLPNEFQYGSIIGIWYYFCESKTTNILDFKGIRDRIGYHINYEESSAIHNVLISRSLMSDHPVDISAGTQRMFIFLDFTHH